MSKSIVISFAIVLICGVASAGDVLNRWSTMSATEFTRCAARNDCAGEAPCEMESLVPGGDCFIECLEFGDPPISSPCATLSFADLGWLDAQGFGGHVPCPGGDVFSGTDARVRGTRLSPSSFEIDGEVGQTGIIEKTVEFALFRFAGDPNQFDGLNLDRVSDLVDLGLISASDVLFVTEVTGFGSILETVDVTGIPDDELVMFAGGDGPFPSQQGCGPPDVPAQSTTGTIVLIGLLFLLGTLVLWFGRKRGTA